MRAEVAVGMVKALFVATVIIGWSVVSTILVLWMLA